MPLAETSKCRVQTGGESGQLAEGEKASQHQPRAVSTGPVLTAQSVDDSQGAKDKIPSGIFLGDGDRWLEGPQARRSPRRQFAMGRPFVRH
jgi:hypothetical protein